MRFLISYIDYTYGCFFGLALLLLACSTPPNQQEEATVIPRTTLEKGNNFKVIAYYTGYPDSLDPATLEPLTHIIYGFAALDSGRLSLKEARDSTSLIYLASLKKAHPQLKVMIALGGWGGCESCAALLNTETGRQDFALSTKKFLDTFNIDGLDLDWEYPAIAGYHGHSYDSSRRENFSLLIEEMRQTLGWNYELSFAAGGISQNLQASVDWTRVMPLLDRVNLMSNDLVNGNSPITEHHTPLYSTPEQQQSTHAAVQFLDSLGIERKKILIGAAFYARIWEGVPATNNGLYQPGKFKETILYNQLDAYTGLHPDFVAHWDSVAQAPYLYNPNQMIFATYDDTRSISIKTRYALMQELGGIMFWQLSGDKADGELLQTIDRVRKEYIP